LLSAKPKDNTLKIHDLFMPCPNDACQSALESSFSCQEYPLKNDLYLIIVTMLSCN